MKKKKKLALKSKGDFMFQSYLPYEITLCSYDEYLKMFEKKETIEFL